MQSNEAMRPFEPITPFHIREQLWELLNGSGSVRERVFSLLTTSRSPYRLRERMRGAALVGEISLEECEKISIESVSAALQSKMRTEERTKPFHISMICDGNRRYEREEGMEKGGGHQAGAKQILTVLVPLIAQIPEVGMCSLYLLSCSNVANRDVDELGKLYELIEKKFPQLMHLANMYQLRYVHVGEKEAFPPNIQRILSDLEANTRDNTGLTINLCLNYDTSLEQGYAMKEVVRSHTAEELEGMSPGDFSKKVTEAKWVPAVDAVIRTGGDSRFSGFLGNRPEDANASLHVEPLYLPAFDRQLLLGHLMDFATGERRMGK